MNYSNIGLHDSNRMLISYDDRVILIQTEIPVSAPQKFSLPLQRSKGTQNDEDVQVTVAKMDISDCIIPRQPMVSGSTETLRSLKLIQIGFPNEGDARILNCFVSLEKSELEKESKLNRARNLIDSENVNVSFI